MLSLFEHMTPPKYHRVDNKDPKTVVLSRRMFRELDLSAWLNRPCLIVIGFMQEVPTPIPLRVDGKPAPVNTGLVMVRWILPLPVDEDYLTRP